MNEFCASCPDRGTEICVLPTEKEQRQLASKLRKAKFVERLLYIGAAMSPGGLRSFDESGVGAGVLKAQEAISSQELAVEACITLHDA